MTIDELIQCIKRYYPRFRYVCDDTGYYKVYINKRGGLLGSGSTLEAALEDAAFFLTQGY